MRIAASCGNPLNSRGQKPPSDVAGAGAQQRLFQHCDLAFKLCCRNQRPFNQPSAHSVSVLVTHRVERPCQGMLRNRNGRRNGRFYRRWLLRNGGRRGGECHHGDRQARVPDWAACTGKSSTAPSLYSRSCIRRSRSQASTDLARNACSACCCASRGENSFSRKCLKVLTVNLPCGEPLIVIRDNPYVRPIPFPAIA